MQLEDSHHEVEVVVKPQSTHTQGIQIQIVVTSNGNFKN